MQAKPLQVVAGGLLKAPGHIGHVSEWHLLFNVQPLIIFAFLHGLDEPVPIIVPLSAAERGDLAGVETPHHMDQVHEVIHWVVTGDSSSFSRSSGGGPVPPGSRARGWFLATSPLSRLWSPPCGHTLASSRFSLGDWGSKPYLLRCVYCLLVWGGWNHLMAS